MAHKTGTPNCKPIVATDLIARSTRLTKERNKMSDLQKWKDFLSSYKVLYTEEDNTKQVNLSASPLWSNSIVLSTNEGKGYSGFTMCIIFNSDGSFRDYGVWE